MRPAAQRLSICRLQAVLNSASQHPVLEAAMKRFVRELGPEDRKTWRRWQAGCVCFYLTIVAVLIGIRSLVPKSVDAEPGQSIALNQTSLSQSSLARVEVK